MLKRLVILAAALAILGTPRILPGDAREEMIRKVENGLCRRVQIGSPAPMNLLERIKSLKVPGLSLAVVKDFELQWAKGYGVRDVRTGAPVTEETLFQAASITKSIDAVVALRLVQDGILDLDKDVNVYLKRWKVPENEFTRVEKVTLRRLLSHTAGLQMSGVDEYAEGEAVPTLLQVLDGLPPAKNTPIRVKAVPGSGYRYSNGGYVVLQLLLEDVTGRALAELAREYVFEPAGMAHSTICAACEGSPAGQTSMGHSVDDAGNVTAFKAYAFLQGGSGCCELWTTPSDLARFVIAMQRALRGDPGSILAKETVRAMITRQENSRTGLGSFLLPYGDAVYFNHDGGNPGFTARFMGHPEEGYGLAVMINSDADGAVTLRTELMMAVAAAYGWDGLNPVRYKDEAALFAEIRRKRGESPDAPASSERGLGELGFELLWTGDRAAAIGVFLLNVEFNPQSALCRDMLGEAYEYVGEAANALASYRRAIELLERFPEKNKGFEYSRAALITRIRNLEKQDRPPAAASGANPDPPGTGRWPTMPQIMPIREQVEVTTRILRKRLDTVLPVALRDAGLDMWLVICQEDDLDPVYRTMIPMDTWPKVLQILIFYDRGREGGVERINLSMTNTSGLYDKPWRGGNHPEQWRLLSEIIRKRDPQRIGINIGAVNWAAGGLTRNLYDQLIRAIPKKYVKRLRSAERACDRWAMTLTEDERELYPRVSSIARQIIARCFSPSSITPDVTTLQDLEWLFWQMGSERGLEQSFKPYFSILRSDRAAKDHPDSDGIIRRGDVLICDVGIRYLGLYTDHQEVAYVRQIGETDAPEGLKSLLTTNNRLQNIFMREFKAGLTGNQVLVNILSSARKAGISSPMIYSHSLGLFVHEPGPVIGLPWEQKPFPGRGDVKLEFNSCYAMELSIEDTVQEWDNQRVWCPTEQIVLFTEDGCKPLDGVQTRFYLI